MAVEGEIFDIDHGRVAETATALMAAAAKHRDRAITRETKG